MVTLKPFLWYTDKAEEAAEFYASVIPNSKVLSVSALPAESPSGPAGSVKVVDFILAGTPFQAMSAGELDNFNHAISFVLSCDTQEEVDRLWEALGAGGEYEPCGWLKDRYGVSWQIVPAALDSLMYGGDAEQGKRVAEAMLQMGKLDLPTLMAAANG